MDVMQYQQQEKKGLQTIIINDAIFITTSGCLARKREWVHFEPNPWDWDGNEICGQIFSGSRTGHTCSVRLVDFEGEGFGTK